ncbi:MAG: hypothetical protein PVH61_40100 [Candidatus Aminicenantes bacterium]|jgi:hypothetical protein
MIKKEAKKMIRWERGRSREDGNPERHCTNSRWQRIRDCNPGNPVILRILVQTLIFIRYRVKVRRQEELL